jgi:hypothetical protein
LGNPLLCCHHHHRSLSLSLSRTQVSVSQCIIQRLWRRQRQQPTNQLYPRLIFKQMRCRWAALLDGCLGCQGRRLPLVARPLLLRVSLSLPTADSEQLPKPGQGSTSSSQPLINYATINYLRNAVCTCLPAPLVSLLPRTPLCRKVETAAPKSCI